MKKIIFSLVVVLCFACENSTVYSGYVYDENQEPLSEVKVQIVGSDIFTSTDEKGYFSIDHKDRGDEILIIKEGYEMQFYTPESQSENIKLVLKEKE